MSSIRLLATLLCAFLVASIALAQSEPRPPVHKADQISMSIDLSWNIRSAVTKFQQDRRLRLYKLASIRTTQCGILYGLLGAMPSSDAETAAALGGASNAFFRAGTFLWPDSHSEHEAMLKDAQTYLNNLRSDQRKTLLFMQGCKDLAGTEEAAYKVISAWSRGLD